jgi:hypothetical protein
VPSHGAVYALQVQQQKSLEDAIDNEICRPTSEDDTHPSPVDRFRLLSRVVYKNQPARSGPMWDLFANREAITKEMSSEIEKMAREGAISEESCVTTQQPE